MSKRKTIFSLVVCFSIAVFTVQTLSQTPMPKRSRNMTDAEWKKEIEKWRAQRKLEREQWRKESKKRAKEHRRQSELKSEQWRKAWEKEKAEGFLHEKYALGATKEQWKVIKPKLEKVQDLRRQVKTSMRAGWGPRRLPGSSGAEYMDPKYLHEWTWKWFKPSESKDAAELSESERIVEDLINLVQTKNTTAEEFNLKMDALRKIRSRLETEKKKKKEELSKAIKELRKVLTTRQEAALVLMGWL